MLRRVRALEASFSFSVWRNTRGRTAPSSRLFCDKKDGAGGDGEASGSGKANLPAKARDLRVQRRKSADLIVPKTDLTRFKSWREDLPTNVNALEYKLFHPTDKSKQVLNKRLFQKPLQVTEQGEDAYETIRPIEGGINRALDQMRPRKYQKTKFRKEDVAAFYDIVIVGGGVMGLSAAYFLAQRVFDGLNILVVEKDPTVSCCFSFCPSINFRKVGMRFSVSDVFNDVVGGGHPATILAGGEHRDVAVRRRLFAQGQEDAARPRTGDAQPQLSAPRLPLPRDGEGRRADGAKSPSPNVRLKNDNLWLSVRGK